MGLVVPVAQLVLVDLVYPAPQVDLPDLLHLQLEEWEEYPVTIPPAETHVQELPCQELDV